MTLIKAGRAMCGPPWRALNWLCFAIIILTVVLKMWWPTAASLSDLALNINRSNQVCSDQEYPLGFAYPPPAVLFWHALGSLGFPTARAAWLLLLPVSLAGSLLLSICLARGNYASNGDWRGGLILLVAFVGTRYYLLWDAQIGNVNTLYLMVVLLALWCWQKERNTWAGICLAISVALKIYSIAFLPLLLFRKQWRIALVSAAAIVFLFLAVPGLCFGGHNAVILNRRWLELVVSSSRPDYLLSYPAYKISLGWTALLLLYAPASQGQANVLDWNINSVALAVSLVQLGWLLLVTIYFLRFPPPEAQTRRGRLAFALDCAVVLLLPLPLSPFLQPHHGAVLLFPAVALLSAAFDKDAPGRTRPVAILAVAAGACLAEFVNPPWEGIAVMLTVAVYFAAIWMVRGDRRLETGKTANEACLAVRLASESPATESSS